MGGRGRSRPSAPGSAFYRIGELAYRWRIWILAVWVVALVAFIPTQRALNEHHGARTSPRHLSQGRPSPGVQPQPTTPAGGVSPPAPTALQRPAAKPARHGPRRNVHRPAASNRPAGHAGRQTFVPAPEPQGPGGTPPVSGGVGSQGPGPISLAEGPTPPLVGGSTNAPNTGGMVRQGRRSGRPRHTLPRGHDHLRGYQRDESDRDQHLRHGHGHEASHVERAHGHHEGDHHGRTGHAVGAREGRHGGGRHLGHAWRHRWTRFWSHELRRYWRHARHHFRGI